MSFWYTRSVITVATHLTCHLQVAHKQYKFHSHYHNDNQIQKINRNIIIRLKISTVTLKSDLKIDRKAVGEWLLYSPRVLNQWIITDGIEIWAIGRPLLCEVGRLFFE